MDAKKFKVESIPSWMNDVMQGICYWIGHRKSYVRSSIINSEPLTIYNIGAAVAHIPRDLF